MFIDAANKSKKLRNAVFHVIKAYDEASYLKHCVVSMAHFVKRGLLLGVKSIAVSGLAASFLAKKEQKQLSSSTFKSPWLWKVCFYIVYIVDINFVHL